MKITNKLLAISALCLLTSFSAFSQKVIEPSDKSVATNEVKTATESTEAVKSKTEEKMAAPAKRQSGSSDSWKGFYIGGNVGGTVANHSLVTSTTFCGGFNLTVPVNAFVSPANGCFFAQSSVDLVNRAGNQDVKPKEFTGGMQTGYNFQAGKFVVGVEADFNSARQNQTVIVRDNYTNVTPQYPFQVSQTIKTDWLMTVRPRAGFTAGKALIYGTGGLAVTNINYQMNFEDFPPTPPLFSINGKAVSSNTIKETKAGWTAGAGAEFKISDKWSVKGEYLYTQFNAGGVSNNVVVTTINSSGGVNGTPTTVANQTLTNNVKLKSNNFRFGINYRF